MLLFGTIEAPAHCTAEWALKMQGVKMQDMKLQDMKMRKVYEVYGCVHRIDLSF